MPANNSNPNDVSTVPQISLDLVPSINAACGIFIRDFAFFESCFDFL